MIENNEILNNENLIARFGAESTTHDTKIKQITYRSTQKKKTLGLGLKVEYCDMK